MLYFYKNNEDLAPTSPRSAPFLIVPTTNFIKTTPKIEASEEEIINE
jgi:hypothetical protein